MMGGKGGLGGQGLFSKTGLGCLVTSVFVSWSVYVGGCFPKVSRKLQPRTYTSYAFL